MKISTKNIQLKFIILILLILIPICILYFNLEGKIFFYLKNSNSSIKNNSNIDNFTNNNYINLCKNKTTYFYDFPIPSTGQTLDYLTISGSSQSKTACEKKCNDDNCQIYIHNSSNNNCYLYDFSNYSYDIPSSIDFSINCNDQYLPSTEYSSISGEGKINRYLYEFSNNKVRFKHIDFMLNKANKIINQFNYIKKLRLNYKNPTHSGVSSELIDAIFNNYNDLHGNLNNLRGYLNLSPDHTNLIYGDDISRYFTGYPYIKQKYNDANTYSAFLNTIPNLKNLSYAPNNTNTDELYLNYNIHKNSKNSNELQSKLEDNKIETKRNIMLYNILAIIMIISVIILLLYKFIPNIIPDYVIICYFIGILLLLYFINKLY